MTRFKPDVRIAYFDARLGDVLTAACVWSLLAGVDVEVNSISDDAPGRRPTSLHRFHLAMDLDTVGDRPADLAALDAWLRRTLPPIYDVVDEGDHVHVEWDAHARRLRGMVNG